MISTYFTGIKDIILEQLGSSCNNVLIAVAWITDNEIINKLIELSNRGISIKIIVSANENNFERNFQINLILKEINIQLFACGDADTYTGQTMHNKFAIIDNKVLLTGSYNWTQKASINYENLLVINDSNVVEKFTSYFKDLQKKSYLISANDNIGIIDEHIRKQNIVLSICANYKNEILNLISYKYSLSEVLLDKNENELSWNLISVNDEIHFNTELIDRFYNNINWRNFSKRSNVNWSISLLDKFSNDFNWGWDGLSSNQNLPWSENLLEHFYNKWC